MSSCHNREAVLELLGRSTEDLAALQCAIRWSDGDSLESLFRRTHAIRRGISSGPSASISTKT